MKKRIKIVIATIRPWNIDQVEKFAKRNKELDVTLITKRRDLTIRKITDICPKYIFFPHWSWEIPENIYKNYECIIFHMTDVPFGRGGSPLQNLILRNVKKTKISAMRVEKDVDAGPVYLKSSLSLMGSAKKIFMEASKIIFEIMMPYIISNNPLPVQQTGKVEYFDRLHPDQSNIEGICGIKRIYDHIRMLDADEYPKAFLETPFFRLEFSNARYQGASVVAQVVIKEKNE
jgi:methionyl-tRNA formyltransferase